VASALARPVPDSGGDVTDQMIAARATRRRNAAETLDQHDNTPLPLPQRRRRAHQ
jgi:hypothetical protein